MKTKVISYKWIQACFVLLMVVMGFTACSVEDNNSASTTDPLPFPMDANKDLSIRPGDDFYQYCNGTWLNNTPIPET